MRAERLHNLVPMPPEAPGRRLVRRLRGFFMPAPEAQSARPPRAGWVLSVALQAGRQLRRLLIPRFRRADVDGPRRPATHAAIKTTPRALSLELVLEVGSAPVPARPLFSFGRSGKAAAAS